MRMGPGNDGPEPDALFLQAIRHAVAASACSRAAQVDRTSSRKWFRVAEAQRCALRETLGHAALTIETACVAASTSSVTPFWESPE